MHVFCEPSIRISIWDLPIAWPKRILDRIWDFMYDLILHLLNDIVKFRLVKLTLQLRITQKKLFKREDYVKRVT